MKNIKFAAFCLGLAGAVGIAVAGLGAQGPSTPRSSRADVQILDLGGSQLGVMASDIDARGAATATGVRIDEVTGGSAAEKAGLKAGDIVTEFDGERVRSARQFTRLVRETPEGRTVKMSVLRDGQRQVLDATPENRAFTWNMDLDRDELRRGMERGLREFRVEPPVFDFRSGPGEPRRFEFRVDPDARPGARGTSRGRLGVTVSSLSPQLAEFFGTTDGALVSTVTKDSAAEKAGIKAGDVITAVNGDQIRGADDLIREVGEAQGTELTIGIMRDRKASTVKATIEPRSGRRSIAG